MAVTLKFQSSGAIPGDAAPIPMRGPSLTVGRGDSNDLVLPDPDQLLSRNHCAIEDHNGNVVVVDLSSNGTFLNYSKIPLGRTPTPLNNGDVLSIGNYEMVVEIRSDLADVGDMIAAPASEGPASHGMADNAPDPMDLMDDIGPGGDFLDDLLGGATPTGPSQINPVDPIDDLLPPMGEDEDPFFQKPADGREGEGASLSSHNASGQDAFAPQVAHSTAAIPDDWDDDFLSGIGEVSTPTPTPTPISEPLAELATAPPPPPPVAPPAPATVAPVKVEPVQETAPVAIEQNTSKPSSGGADQSAAIEAFLRGLGAEDLKIDTDDQENTLARMGRVMRTLVTGLREILMTRASIKSEFRIEQTMISAGGNNPLKFSITPEQAIEAMVRPASRGYLSPETAAEQALNDIKAHEVAMLTGMEAALKGVLTRLDPKVLETQIQDKGGIGGLLKGKKARYWDVYERLYSEIADQAENDFHDLFSREFSRAYKQQLDRLKE